MPEGELEMPAKFSFDEFYEMLKELVNDPEARECLAAYDAEANAGRGQVDDSTASDLAHDSLDRFNSLSWSVMVAHGYPTYGEMIEMTKDNFELREDFWTFGGIFRGIAKRLIRKTDGYLKWLQEDFQDQEFDINDRSSVLRLLKLWKEKKAQVNKEVPFVLPDEFIATDSEINDKPLIPFDEYYSVLNSCVLDPHVINAVNEWHNVREAYYANGGDPLTDCRDESDECYDAYGKIGATIWKSIHDHEFEAFIELSNSDRRGVLNVIVMHFIEGGWPQVLPDLSYEIHDQQLVKEILRRIARENLLGPGTEKAMGLAL